jgi:predicted CXXCH cytochrome family protein
MISVILLSFFLVITLGGCETNKNYKILSFFFDGVPPPEAPKPKETKVPSTTEVARKPETTPSEIFTHKPFGENKCAYCHDLTRGNIVDTTSALCFRCHSSEKFKGNVVHYPVAEGLCLHCHDPHQSGFKFQLRNSLSILCFDCHDKAIIEGKVKHPAVEMVGCTFCHLPHSSSESRLLQMPMPELCLACHDKDNSHIKDMVATKLVCNQCHSPHSTKEAKLLK